MFDIKDTSNVFLNGKLSGDGVVDSTRTLGETASIYEHGESLAGDRRQETAYEVSSYLPEKEGTEGGLYFGVTTIFPGVVGDEYLMTKGHFHSRLDTAEFYWGIEGEGMLILMDSDRRVWGERMFPGSLHYIPGGVAHRVANTGAVPLVFGACWPSDAGHDYGTIEKEGFAARLKKTGEGPKLVRS